MPIFSDHPVDRCRADVQQVNRRQSLSAMAATGSAVGFANPLMSGVSTAQETDIAHLPKGGVEHVISIWLGGGMGQIDTFDPKQLGDPKTRKAGAYYPSIPTAVDGVHVCEHLKNLAPLMDRVTAIRSVHHEMIDEHAAATNRMHTGRPVSGTITYPSIGSIVSHERGPAAPGVPAYVLIGYPNVTRGPGFLGSSAGYLYLTDTSKGPAGLSPAVGIDAERQSRRERFLNAIGETREAADRKLQDYEATIAASLKLSGPEFQRVFELDRESDDLRNRYGGEFGQRCLLSRRLAERGVRFIEVSHNLNFLNGAGWDVHNQGILQQHALIQELDTAVATLIEDLERLKMLDKTLIAITTEFGRPPEFDSAGGRGHQGRAFTCVLAGGGLRHCGAYGETDELSKKIVSDPVSVPDFFATICAAAGIDPSRYLYDGDRPVPVTDNGIPVAKLFS